MKRFAILFMTLVMLVTSMFISVAIVSADETCAHTKLRLFESKNQSGDYIDLCGDIADLNNITHTQAGNCDNALLGDNSWDDCASSFKIINNTHNLCVGIFSNPRGATQWPLLEGGRLAAYYGSNFDSGEDNMATSIDWWSSDVCPGNG